jgi:hypothetical protein
MLACFRMLRHFAPAARAWAALLIGVRLGQPPAWPELIEASCATLWAAGAAAR